MDASNTSTPTSTLAVPCPSCGRDTDPSAMLAFRDDVRMTAACRICLPGVLRMLLGHDGLGGHRPGPVSLN